MPGSHARSTRFHPLKAPWIKKTKQRYLQLSESEGECNPKRYGGREETGGAKRQAGLKDGGEIGRVEQKRMERTK